MQKFNHCCDEKYPDNKHAQNRRKSCTGVERKKVELLSSFRRQRLDQLSFLSESISQKLSKVSI